MKDPSEVPFFPQLCDENTWLTPSYDNYGRSVVIYHEILCCKDRISRLNSHRAQQHQMHTTEASGPNSQHTPKHDGNTPSHHLGKPVYIWSYPFLKLVMITSRSRWERQKQSLERQKQSLRSIFLAFPFLRSFSPFFVRS